MKNFTYIAIEGPIGVGKTTLANILRPLLNAKVIYELGKRNPFMPLFLEFPDKYGLAMQLNFLLDRFRQHAIEIPHCLKYSSVISDCMFERDWIFASLALRENQFNVYQQVYLKFFDQIYYPHIVVYLYGSTATLLKRLNERGDDTTNVWTPQFVEKLCKAYEEFFSAYRLARVVAINIDKVDFVTSSQDVSQLFEKLMSALETDPPGF